MPASPDSAVEPVNVNPLPRWRELTVATEFDRFPQAVRFNAAAVVHAYDEADFDEFRLMKAGN